MERGSHDPDPDAAKAGTVPESDAGFILLSCGYYGITIRILSSLTIAMDHLREGLGSG